MLLLTSAKRFSYYLTTRNYYGIGSCSCSILVLELENCALRLNIKTISTTEISKHLRCHRRPIHNCLICTEAKAVCAAVPSVVQESFVNMEQQFFDSFLKFFFLTDRSSTLLLNTSWRKFCMVSVWKSVWSLLGLVGS